MEAGDKASDKGWILETTRGGYSARVCVCAERARVCSLKRRMVFACLCYVISRADSLFSGLTYLLRENAN